MARFKVKYITRVMKNGVSRTSATYAKMLEKALNEAKEDGHEIVRIETMPDGHLVVSLERSKQTDIFNSLRDQIRGDITVVTGRASDTSLSEDAEKFLDQFFSSVNSREKRVVIDKIPAVLPSVCRKFSNQTLRSIFDSIRAYADEHNKNDHGDGSEPCDLMVILRAVADAGHDYVKQSTC